MKSEKTYAVCNFLSYSFMFHKHFHTMLIITLSQSFKKVRIFMLILTHKPYIFITIAKSGFLGLEKQSFPRLRSANASIC